MKFWRHPDLVSARVRLMRRLARLLFLLVCIVVGISALVAIIGDDPTHLVVLVIALIFGLAMMWEQGITYSLTDRVKDVVKETAGAARDTASSVREIQETYQDLSAQKQEQAGSLFLSEHTAIDGALSMHTAQEGALSEAPKRKGAQVDDLVDAHDPSELRQWALKALDEPQPEVVFAVEEEEVEA